MISKEKISDSYIRVSASNLNCILIDNKYLLSLNRSSLDSGEKIYSAIGGATKYDENAKSFLESIGTDFEGDNDLRFRLQKKDLGSFVSWYSSGINRELSPFRELREELVDEEKIFPSLKSYDFSYLKLGIDQSISKSHRKEKIGELTYRIADIFLTVFRPELEKKIYQNINQKETPLILTTSDEIQNIMTNSKIPIADNCRAFIKFDLEELNLKKNMLLKYLK